MPNEFSNFTAPDTGSYSGGYKGTVTPTYNPRRWGGRGESVDENGNPIAGTSGAAADIDHYNTLANGGNTVAPVIDQTASNESRGFQLGSLDTLRNVANGGMSQAASLGMAQGRDAVAAGNSMAASVRGGAGARVAAARAATMGGAQTMARTRLAASAAQANAMATARGQLANAATTMRGEDIGVATDQAKLEAGNRAANDQRSQHYDQAGFDVANAENNAAVGVSSQDANAANAARMAAQQANSASQANARTVASTITGGVTGAAQGYVATHSADKPDPDPYSTAVSNSDERMKYGITTHLKGAAKHMLESARDARDRYLPRETHEPAAEGNLGGADEARKSALHAGITQQVAQDAVDAPTYGYFTDEEANSRPRGVSGAPVGYAASRAGQAGYMFGPQQDAPMTQHQREVMMSDDHTKLAAAWDEGHQAALNNIKKVGKMTPEQLKASEHPEAVAVRELKGDAYDEGTAAVRSQTYAAKDAKHQADMQWHQQHNVPLPPAAGSPIERPAAWGPAPAAPLPAPPQEEPGYLSQLAGYASRAKAMVSDGDTKYGATDVGAMADANRSMKPRAYKYKAGFAEHEGQSAGEENVGPIAQDMARDPVASTAIVKDPNTGLLGIDKDKGLKLVMGSVADLQAQLDAMKGKRKA